MNPGNPSGDNGPTPMVLGQPPQQQQQQQIQTPGGIAGETKPNCDFPPFSRVFVVCSRNHREDEIKAAFQPYGTVEDVWMVKDRITKENKGICYVKYDRASSAALAIETMDGMMIGEESKPIKAMIASSKNSAVKTDYNDETARTRLFIVCPKEYTEEELKGKFVHFGDFEYCNIIRDKTSGESKGFGYVKFSKASTAALAMENCDKGLKAILAEPKSAKFAREAAAANVGRDQHKYLFRDSFGAGHGTTSPTHTASSMDLFLNQGYPPTQTAGTAAAATGIGEYHHSAMGTQQQEHGINNRLFVIVSPTVGQEQLQRLFDLVPGMVLCDLKRHYTTGDSKGFAYVTYTSITAAMYAKEKLHGFEYPPGTKLAVKYADDPPPHYPPSPTAEPIYTIYHSAPHSPLRSPIKGSPTRSLSPVRPLPNRQRRHSFSSEFDGRVFFICSPQPPAEHILREIFGRFGMLTDVWIVRGKNYGYAKFTSRGSAEAAITALHGMEVFGVKLKVMLADPPPEESTSRNKRPRM